MLGGENNIDDDDDDKNDDNDDDEESENQPRKTILKKIIFDLLGKRRRWQARKNARVVGMGEAWAGLQRSVAQTFVCKVQIRPTKVASTAENFTLGSTKLAWLGLSKAQK